MDKDQQNQLGSSPALPRCWVRAWHNHPQPFLAGASSGTIHTLGEWWRTAANLAYARLAEVPRASGDSWIGRPAPSALPPAQPRTIWKPQVLQAKREAVVQDSPPGERQAGRSCQAPKADRNRLSCTWPPSSHCCLVTVGPVLLCCLGLCAMVQPDSQILPAVRSLKELRCTKHLSYCLFLLSLFHALLRAAGNCFHVEWCLLGN